MRFIKVLRRRMVAEPAPKKLPGEAFAVLILAAGEGTRMESALPKVLHPVSGRPMVFHVLRTASALRPAAIGMVIGFEADKLRHEVEAFLKESSFLKPVTFIRQTHQKGSGHAVLQAAQFLRRYPNVLIMCGDTPLLTYETLLSMLQQHRADKSHISVLTAKLSNPSGYGRILRNHLGEVLKIVEENEATPKETLVNEINSGTYVFDTAQLLEALRDVKPAGPKNELYLTKALEIIRGQGGRVTAHLTANSEETLGVNTRLQQALVERILTRRTLERLMLSGITITDPAHTYVETTVEVGPEVTLYPGTLLRGRTKVGRGAKLGPFTWIEDSQIGADAEIRFSQVVQAKVGDGACVGPFANLRPGSVIGPKARIGNFTEIKASRIGPGAKVPHLSYIGDADIHAGVNIGAGAITCNYDGVKKSQTVVEQDAFIGSNVNLVAPVKIGKGAVVGAGSTITEDVPADHLAIARAHQVVKPRKK